MQKESADGTEPWMRGTHEELDPLRRAVIHALELTQEDVELWCANLDDDQMFARPSGLPPVAFHLRHMARSADRLLTYAEDRWLDEDQLAALGTELAAGTAVGALEEFRQGISSAKERVIAFQPKRYDEARGIGRRRLPTTVGGLLIHLAEHTQRHTGHSCDHRKARQISILKNV